MPKRRRHLYLVFDDWLWGYSIRKVDLASAADGDQQQGRRLPPAFSRLEARGGGLPSDLVAAFGSKIMAMRHDPHGLNRHPLVPSCVAPVLDVRTRALLFSPRPQQVTHATFVPVGDDRLFALSDYSVQLLLCGSRRWRQIPAKPPFSLWQVTCHAVHPDGRTIFFSTAGRGGGTFALKTPSDVEEGGFAWERLGDWTLPVGGGGSAHFDRSLNAWVGLSGDPATAGHLCACDVASARCPDDDPRGVWQWDSCAWQCPTSKLSKEKLFDPAAEDHVGATLVCMGGGGDFCLVHCVRIIAHGRPNYYLQTRPCSYQLRLTTFSLKYDKNGDLTTGNTTRLRRCYQVPQADSGSFLQWPVAFWM